MDAGVPVERLQELHAVHKLRKRFKADPDMCFNGCIIFIIYDINKCISYDIVGSGKRWRCPNGLTCRWKRSIFRLEG